MHELLTPYATALTATALLALIVLLQAIVASASRHVASTGGQVAGAHLEADHSNRVYRLVRSFENSLENLPVFMLSIALAIAFALEPFWLNLAAVVFVAARLGHWAAYAAGKPSLRSTCFALGLSTNLILAVAVLLVALF